MTHVIVTPWAERTLTPPGHILLHIDEIRAILPKKDGGCMIVTQCKLGSSQEIEVAEPFEYFNTTAFCRVLPWQYTK